jgi:hypothetical protein
MEVIAWYWRLFNIGAKVVAVGFIVFGAVVAAHSYPAVMDPNGTVLVNGVPESDFVMRLVSFVAPIVVVILGILLLRAKPFFPRHRDQRNESDT